jgi:hypothetical protein
MRSMQITLDIEFRDDVVTQENAFDITSNIAEALLHEINTKGIVPDNCETYTKEIIVMNKKEAFKVNPSNNTVEVI